jgi:hypothetical protein
MDRKIAAIPNEQGKPRSKDSSQHASSRYRQFKIAVCFHGDAE